MELKEFQQNFGGRYPMREFVFLHAFQNEMPDYADGFYLLVDDKSGLKSWSDNTAFLDRLMPFAQANGTGSFYALWDERKGKDLNAMPIVVFGDEGGVHIVAENILQLMRLLTYDAEIYVDHTEAYFYKSDDAFVSEDASAYREWLKEHFLQDPVGNPDGMIAAAQKKHKVSFDNWMKQFYDAGTPMDLPPDGYSNDSDTDATSFNIISFTAGSKQYYPASMEQQNWMEDMHVKHTDISIAPGQSRYGGPVIDLPPGVTPPENLRFAAQLDLSRFSPFDKTGLLPKTGQLLFFADLLHDKGKVIYADVPNDQLVRTINEHTDHFFLGVLIDEIYADTESMDERFREPEDEDEEEEAGGKIWDYFAGSDRSKIFGIYTHCQASAGEIAAITYSDKILLLQVGENGFNDEGVFSVLIPRADLEQHNFDNCEFAWGQS